MWLIKTNYGKFLANSDELSDKFRSKQDFYDKLKF